VALVETSAQCDSDVDFIDFPVSKSNGELVWLSERLPALIVFFGQDSANTPHHSALSQSLLTDSAFISGAKHNIIYVLDRPPVNWLEDDHFLRFVIGPEKPPHVTIATAQEIASWTSDTDSVLVSGTECETMLHLYFDQAAQEGCVYLDGGLNMATENNVGCNSFEDVISGDPMNYIPALPTEASSAKAAVMMVCSDGVGIKDFGVMAWDNTMSYLDQIIADPSLSAETTSEATELLVNHLSAEIDELLLSFDEEDCGSVEFYPRLENIGEQLSIDCGEEIPPLPPAEFLLESGVVLAADSILVDSLLDYCPSGFTSIKYTFIPQVPYLAWIPAGVLESYTYSINLEDNQAPVWSLPSISPLIPCEEIERVVAQALPPGVQDECSEDEFIEISAGVVEAYLDDTAPFYSKTWQATDVCGNSSSLSQFFFIEPTEIPDDACPQDVIGLTSVDSIDPILHEMGVPVLNLYTTTSYSYEDAYFDRGVSRTWLMADGCGAEASCEQLLLLVEPITPKDDGLLIYPNPAMEETRLVFDQKFGPIANVRVYDDVGKAVGHYNRIDTSQPLATSLVYLEGGQYFVEVKYSSGHQVTRPLVKK